MYLESRVHGPTVVYTVEYPLNKISACQLICNFGFYQ